jgi:membrane-associated phospholipid phosphatase
MTHVARLLRGVRPAEWVVLIFGAFLILQLERGGPVDLDPEGGVPRLDMFSAILVVVVARQALVFRHLRWPEGSPIRWAHWLLFPLTLAPAFLDLLWVGAGPHEAGTGGTLAIGMLWLHWMLRRMTLSGLPLISLWLALGTHIKQNQGSIHALPFARDCAVGVAQTLRDWAPPVLLVLSYSLMGEVLSRQYVPDRDAQLAALDRALFFGVDPVHALQHIACRPVSEWLALSYGFYAPLYPLALGLVYGLADRRGFALLVLELSLALAVGYALYTVVPAQGPIFTQRFEVPLDGYYFQGMQEQLMDRYRVPRDCFPSLHTAVSLVFLSAAWRWVRPFFWTILPLVASIPLACLYFRYHYATDIVGGVALASAILWSAPRLEAWWIGQGAPETRARIP